MTPSAMAAPSAAFVPVDIPFEEGGEETPLSVAVVVLPRSTVVPVPVTGEFAGEDALLVEEVEIVVEEEAPNAFV
jgi:hypothetical protein